MKNILKDCLLVCAIVLGSTAALRAFSAHPTITARAPDNPHPIHIAQISENAIQYTYSSGLSIIQTFGPPIQLDPMVVPDCLLTVWGVGDEWQPAVNGGTINFDWQAQCSGPLGGNDCAMMTDVIIDKWDPLIDEWEKVGIAGFVSFLDCKTARTFTTDVTSICATYGAGTYLVFAELDGVTQVAEFTCL